MLWLALSAPLDLRLYLYRAGEATLLLTADFPSATAEQVRLGQHAFVRLIDLQPTAPLPVDELLEYDLRVTPADAEGSPGELLTKLWLYGTSAPLNWLTRRRRLRLRARRPNGNRRRRLYNGSALGRVRLDAGGTPVDIRLLTADGGEVAFPKPP